MKVSFARTVAAFVVLLGTILAGPAWTADAKVHTPNPLDFSMSFLADVRDSPECRVSVEQGDLVFGEDVTNPTQSCPDAFAWKLFIESVTNGFWENWATNRQTWPSDPWPRCAAGETSGKCCLAVEVSNKEWPEHCPVFPGVTEGMPEEAATKPAIAQQVSLAQAATADVNRDGKLDWKDVPAALRDIVIGSVQGELVYRNEKMVDYIFDNELYSTDGLARVFANFNHASDTYAPYSPVPEDPGASHPKPPVIATMSFPIKSVMIKTDWLSVDDARQLGIDPYDTAHPFIIVNLLPIQDSNKPPPAGGPKPKPHILLAFHISSKDLPNWFWATFEHVANQGRCDWTGCNDSFGYLATKVPAMDKVKVGNLAAVAQNFTPPHQTAKAAGYDQAAFVLGERYLDEDSIGETLAEAFTAHDIGTGNGINRSGRPTAQDQAWRSYRLKGTQTDFVTPTGRPTHLGNSVTEAGFVSTASCITCHARAGATEDGMPPLAIFTNTLSDLGMPQSVNGTPNDAWFNINAYRNAEGVREATGTLAVQTDFVWGFRNACPMKQTAIGPNWCKNVAAAKK